MLSKKKVNFVTINEALSATMQSKILEKRSLILGFCERKKFFTQKAVDTLLMISLSLD